MSLKNVVDFKILKLKVERIDLDLKLTELISEEKEILLEQKLC